MKLWILPPHTSRPDLSFLYWATLLSPVLLKVTPSWAARQHSECISALLGRQYHLPSFFWWNNLPPCLAIHCTLSIPSYSSSPYPGWAKLLDLLSSTSSLIAVQGLQIWTFLRLSAASGSLQSVVCGGVPWFLYAWVWVSTDTKAFLWSLSILSLA